MLMVPCPNYHDGYPTLDDWEAHLSTIFPEVVLFLRHPCFFAVARYHPLEAHRTLWRPQVRLKKFLEMRGADSGRWKMICALPAFWVGLLYDDDAQAAAYNLISDFTPYEHEHLRSQVKPRSSVLPVFNSRALPRAD